MQADYRSPPYQELVEESSSERSSRLIDQDGLTLMVRTTKPQYRYTGQPSEIPGRQLSVPTLALFKTASPFLIWIEFLGVVDRHQPVELPFELRVGDLATDVLISESINPISRIIRTCGGLLTVPVRVLVVHETELLRCAARMYVSRIGGRISGRQVDCQ